MSLKFLYHRLALLVRFLFKNDDERELIFCISMQRTGTTSVGKFLRDFGYSWMGWPADQRNGWSELWLDGNYEKIFSSLDFCIANAFEDSPWFLPDFYKILYHRYPKSKFILLTRNSDDWFKSMVSHSRGNVIGKSRIHAKIYRREIEYFDLLRSGMVDDKTENTFGTEKAMKLAGFDERYKEIYRLHLIEAQDFFARHSPESLFVGELSDPGKWQKLGKFLNIDVPADYESHENSSKRKR